MNKVRAGSAAARLAMLALVAAPALLAPSTVKFQLDAHAVDPDRPGSKGPSGLFHDGARSEDHELLQVEVR